MPRYTDKDYQKLAKAITSDFIEDGVPLSQSFQKVARDGKMNAHEARRLLEATNVTAHLDLFEKMGAERYVEFEALEPDDELPTLFDVEKVASLAPQGPFGLGLDLPDERWGEMRPQVEKIAAAEVPVLEEPPKPGKYDGVRGYNAARLVEKTAEEIESRLRIAHMDYEDELDKLATLFRRVDAMDYAEFEKDAMAIHGPGSEPVIAKLREKLRVAPRPLEKNASRLVITRREHDALQGVMAAFAQAKDYANAYQFVAERVG